MSYDMPRSYDDVESYHIHIYFHPDQSRVARELRTWISERFYVELGTWHDGPFGPHTLPSYYVGFRKEVLPSLLPWIILNRRGLNILIHPNTDSPLDDHTTNALWLGTPQNVNTDNLPHSLQAIGLPLKTINPNTYPHLIEF